MLNLFGPKSRAFGVAAAGVVAATSTALVPATSAHAAVDCSHSKSTSDNWTGGIDGTAALHTGPYGSCRVTSHETHGIHIFCQVRNSEGNTWFYVEDETTGHRGWLWEGNVRWTFGGHWGC